MNLDGDKLALIASLAQPMARGDTSARLAACYHARELLIFEWDDTVENYLPAPAFKARLRDGRAWQSFLRRCGQVGHVKAELPLNDDSGAQPVLGRKGADGLIVVLIGGAPAIDGEDPLFQLLPLLARAFSVDRQAREARSNLLLAQEKAEHASMLAESLERARRDLAAALREARAAQDALQISDRRKDEFLAILAHELRNPLAPIANGLELMKQQDMGEPLSGVRSMMEQQLRHMVRLIDDLMDISRISRGKISLQMENVSLAQAIHMACQESRPLYESMRHTLELDLPDEVLAVHADMSRLLQIFSNLLNNAAKYTPPGGLVCISVREADGHALVSVRDNGVGLEPNQTERIFELFAQVGNKEGKSVGGLGVGLALVRNLVTLHAGVVSVSSQGLGKGSDFTVKLPLVEASATKARPAAAVGPAADAAKTSFRVLVVDDNEDSAETLGLLLRMRGHQTRLAFNGQEALATARHFQPNLILLDIGLPDMDGYTVCRKLRELDALQDTTLVAQTGWGQVSDKRLAQEAGFHHHLTKPVQLTQIQDILREMEEEVMRK